MCKRFRIAEKICLVLGIFTCIYLGETYDVRAAETMYYVPGKSYGLEDSSGYTVTGASKNSLCFGEKSIGELTVMGNITDISTYVAAPV